MTNCTDSPVLSRLWVCGILSDLIIMELVAPARSKERMHVYMNSGVRLFNTWDPYRETHCRIGGNSGSLWKPNESYYLYPSLSVTFNNKFCLVPRTQRQPCCPPRFHSVVFCDRSAYYRPRIANIPQPWRPELKVWVKRKIYGTISDRQQMF